MRTVQYELLRPDEITSEKERFPVVYLPFSPIEWHGQHNPMGVDGLYAQYCARKVAEKIGGVVLPTLFMGTFGRLTREQVCDHGFQGDEDIKGMDYPANTIPSMYYREDVMMAMLRETIRLMDEQEYRVICIVNCHGPFTHMHVIDEIVEECNHTNKHAKVVVGTAAGDAGIQGGHGTLLETSAMMYITDSVDLAKLPSREESPKLYGRNHGIADDDVYAGNPQPDHSVVMDPREASRELGEKAVINGIKNVSKRVLDTLEDCIGSGKQTEGRGVL